MLSNWSSLGCAGSRSPGQLVLALAQCGLVVGVGLAVALTQHELKEQEREYCIVDNFHVLFFGAFFMNCGLLYIIIYIIAESKKVEIFVSRENRTGTGR